MKNVGKIKKYHKNSRYERKLVGNMQQPSVALLFFWFGCVDSFALLSIENIEKNEKNEEKSETFKEIENNREKMRTVRNIFVDLFLSVEFHCLIYLFTMPIIFRNEIK